MIIDMTSDGSLVILSSPSGHLIDEWDVVCVMASLHDISGSLYDYPVCLADLLCLMFVFYHQPSVIIAFDLPLASIMFLNTLYCTLCVCVCVRVSVCVREHLFVCACVSTSIWVTQSPCC